MFLDLVAAKSTGLAVEKTRLGSVSRIEHVHSTPERDDTMGYLHEKSLHSSIKNNRYARMLG